MTDDDPEQLIPLNELDKLQQDYIRGQRQGWAALAVLAAMLSAVAMCSCCAGAWLVFTYPWT